jgi:hypothetical protein
MPTAYAHQEEVAPAASNKGRVFGTQLTNANAKNPTIVAKDGPLTRAQARALKEAGGAPKIAAATKPEEPPMMVPPVVQPVVTEVSVDMDGDALAEEVGEISLDPTPLPNAFEDPQEVGVYINDIMQYFSRKEAKCMPSPSYLKQVQKASMDASARATLVDWVINVHRKFKLLKPVLPLAINIMDRFLSVRQLKKDQLQLLGAASLLIASKFEEIYPPEVEDFVHISDRAFKKAAVIQMEGEVLNTLKFEVSVPTTFAFMSRFLKVAQADEDTEKMAELIVDAAMLEYSMLKYLPSVVATSSVVLAQSLLRSGRWNADMEAHTGYTKAALTPCIKDLVNVLRSGYHHRMSSLVKKYGEDKVQQASEATC